MSESKYKIQKLKGAKNLHRWKEEIEAVFIMEDCWEVVCGDELVPTKPDPTTEKSLKEYEKELKA